MDKIKKILVPVVMGLLIAVLAVKFLGPTPPQVRDVLASEMESKSWKWFAKEQNLSQFATDIRAGRVKDIGIGIEYAFVDLDKDARYYVRIDSQRGLFLDLLKEKSDKPAPSIVGIGDVSPPQSEISKVTRYLTVPNAMTALMVFMVIGVAMQLGVIDKSRKMFKRVQRPSLRFNDIIGAEDAKESVRDLVAYLKNPKHFTKLGAKPPRGIILAGPPGTGKTLLAEALAGEAGCSFIAITGSDFSDKFLGVGVGRVKKLFETARKDGPTVVFIDEIDAIGRRTSGGDAASNENNRIINAMLVEMDGFHPNDGVIFVGATNNLQHLDPAMVREGRFDRVCHLTLPSINEREALFKLYAGKLVTATDLDCRQLARLSAGMAPAAIAGVSNAAALLGAKENALAVTHDHFMRSLERQSMGSPSESGKAAMSEKERIRVAVHEAGHAVASTALGMGVVEKVSIIPRGGAGGVTWVTEDQDITLYTEEQLVNRLAVLLAGRGAEQLVLKSRSTGASNDLERVTNLAHQMVTKYGFSKKLGGLSYYGLPEESRKDSLVSEDVMFETREIIAAADLLMTETLAKHQVALDAVTAALLEFETIPGDSVTRAIAKSHPMARAA